MSVMILQICLILIIGPTLSLSTDCYRKIRIRGTPSLPNVCPSGMSQDGLLCFTPCNSGYSGEGPLCTQNCPVGYTDLGFFCAPTIQFSDMSNCAWYDVCGVGSNCVTCPAGYSSYGCLCVFPGTPFAKNTYYRGMGRPLGCATTLQNDAGLCYPFCSSGWQPTGPLCWSSCPGAQARCGILCIDNPANCVNQARNFTELIINIIFDFIECAYTSGSDCNIEHMAQEILTIFKDVDLQFCNSSSSQIDSLIMILNQLESHPKLLQEAIKIAQAGGQILKEKQEIRIEEEKELNE